MGHANDRPLFSHQPPMQYAQQEAAWHAARGPVPPAPPFDPDEALRRTEEHERIQAEARKDREDRARLGPTAPERIRELIAVLRRASVPAIVHEWEVKRMRLVSHRLRRDTTESIRAVAHDEEYPALGPRRSDGSRREGWHVVYLWRIDPDEPLESHLPTSVPARIRDHGFHVWGGPSSSLDSDPDLYGVARGLEEFAESKGVAVPAWDPIKLDLFPPSCHY